MTKSFKIALTSTGILLGITGILASIITYNWNKKQVHIFSLQKPKQLKKAVKLNISEKLKINKEELLKKQEINLPKVVNLESAIVVNPPIANYKKLEEIKDKISEKIGETFSLKLKKNDILKWVIENPYKSAGIISGAIAGAGLVVTSTFFTVLFITKPHEYVHFKALLLKSELPK
ncbi:hypothetical protein [Mycoplasma phocimorsus]|uniref:hypothetical protein n=1 Tax=Mycoplasma phocimorsus TaxID=3045839 RepID=UPI0024BF4C99|nr:hypothetical protein [Mycoplasma phocimorsus]MDJ1649121.1 hypothetical protein [Mycoplasma phocimorsus]